MAESFGTDPARYDRARPRYPDALVEAIVEASVETSVAAASAAASGREALGAGAPGREVLDVGCGTGIVSRQFQAAGCRVLGVDVDARMAEFARSTGVEAEVAKFEEWDPAGRVFDAVVSGQSWHWVDPVAGAVMAAKVLRPGGRLAVFWNVNQPPPDLAEAFRDIYRRVMPGFPATTRPSTAPDDDYSPFVTRASDGVAASGAFGEAEQWRFGWERGYTRDEWLDMVPTSGGFSRLSRADVEEVLSSVGAAIDAVGGAFTMRYTTLVVTATRLDHS
ncbi:class I SAM-dependent methyltransferase [Streptosporangiaceae bacterium NEAU-GS5]|nr:class I SAM-dependent methyltransferase [Streptosporangiaceae bacterium NEAU-GS5]